MPIDCSWSTVKKEGYVWKEEGHRTERSGNERSIEEKQREAQEERDLNKRNKRGSKFKRKSQKTLSSLQREKSQLIELGVRVRA